MHANPIVSTFSSHYYESLRLNIEDAVAVIQLAFEMGESARSLSGSETMRWEAMEAFQVRCQMSII